MTAGRARRCEVVVPGDLGPLIRQPDGRLAPHRSRVVEAIADVPGRRVTRAVRSPGYDRLWRRGVLSDAQREAADLYVRLCEQATGARDSDAAQVRIDGGWLRGDGPTLAQMQAVARLRDANDALGHRARLVVERVVVADEPPSACAAVFGVPGELNQDARYNRVLGLLDAALQRLVEHWRLDA
ncbi:MAG: hypothetical protein N2688_00005 [Burkholderiaceae bacterium]|nr:hypothetical protein [Burkholderiaceae bacterium]